MAIQTFKSRVSEHNTLARKFHWLQLELVDPPRIEFQAGQYVMLTIPGSERKKSYSIASPPALNHQIDLLADVAPQGEGTTYLQSLEPGQEVEFMAPAGQFFLVDNPTEQKLVFVASGSGITSIRSMILDLLQTRNDTRQIKLHWGLRFIDDVFWEEELRLLKKHFPNFEYDLVLSKSPEDWPLCTGHVNDCLEHHYQDFSNTGYYVCGNQSMIEGVSQMLANKGVDNQFIHHEKFY